MTDAKSLVPAALYLRMSTEHQQYSLENQSMAIRKYADSRGFEVVQTYSDAARSGLVLKRRAGLRQLLQDVVAGSAPYRVILVYDVSRWGRFQDTDESAHYEFLCKSAGIPVHYCAETFANDGSLPSLIMKALKRTMAGEYSRELGVKVLAGQKRLAGLGFKQGGMPGYGLRRLLISNEGHPKQPLAYGERKSLATDRVILIPGSAHEVQVVRDIYRMLISDGMSIYAIAGELNRRAIGYHGGSRWTHYTVADVLTRRSTPDSMCMAGRQADSTLRRLGFQDRSGFLRRGPLSQSWIKQRSFKRSKSSQTARLTNRMRNCSTA
jgi:DNA invertase Pin-like site-specific DNA recombinase